MDQNASKTLQYLYQIQENWAGRIHNHTTYKFTAHFEYGNAEMNLKSTNANGFNFKIINSFMES